MKKAFVLLFALSIVARCFALGTVEVVLAYKLNGVQHRQTLVLGVGGETTPDVDRSGESAYNGIGTFEWYFPDCPSGYDFRFATERGYNSYRIGRVAGGSSGYRYPPYTGGYYGRLYFGETYQLDVSGDWSKTNALTDVFVSSSKFDGKKITNMTDSDITYGVAGTSITIPKGSAKWFTATVDRFQPPKWDSSWTVHSEQDWAVTFTPYSWSSGSTVVSYDFPHFANLVIYKPTTPPAIHHVGGSLLYADIEDSSGTNLLYGASGYPLYRTTTNIVDNITVMTEWVFDQSNDPSPHAYINGEDVCAGHATSHIIDYNITAAGDWIYDRSSNCYVIDFSMQLRSGSSASSSSYSVTQRCWFGANAYANADSDKRAEVSGTVGDIAYFRASVNKSTGVKKLQLRQ